MHEIRHPKYMKSQYPISVLNQYYSIPGSLKECYYLPKYLYPRLEHSDPESIDLQELTNPCSKVLKLVKSETLNTSNHYFGCMKCRSENPEILPRIWFSSCSGLGYNGSWRGDPILDPGLDPLRMTSNTRIRCYGSLNQTIRDPKMDRFDPNFGTPNTSKWAANNLPRFDQNEQKSWKSDQIRVPFWTISRC